MSENTYRAVLFFTFLTVFVVTAGVTFWSFFSPTPGLMPFQKTFVGALIVESIGSMFAFWKQVSSGFTNPPNVDGDWQYECESHDKSYKHGGTCEISVRKGATGWEFYIAGKRQWKADLVSGNWVHQDFSTPYPWENTWGTFTGRDSLRYGYSLVKEDGTINGYGSARVKIDSKGRPTLLEGNFYQLAPKDPFVGYQKYFRA